jgi:hypothetical protein
MRFFVLTTTYELRASRKSHLRDHPTTKPAELITRVSSHRLIRLGWAGGKKTEITKLVRREGHNWFLTSLPGLLRDQSLSASLLISIDKSCFNPPTT